MFATEIDGRLQRLTKFPILQAIDLNAAPKCPLPLTDYTALAPTQKTRLRFAEPDGNGLDG
jgi:hypothetical protein